MGLRVLGSTTHVAGGRSHSPSCPLSVCRRQHAVQIKQKAAAFPLLTCGRQQLQLVAAAAAPAVERVSPAQSNQGDSEGVFDVVVVGGGISGLTTAQACLSEHSDAVSRILVTEARDRVGGNLTTGQNNDGYMWEEGPTSFQPNDAMLKAAVDAGLDKDLVMGDPKAPRFVFWDKKLRATPSGPDVVTFDLLSIWGKLRAGLGAAGIKKQAPVRDAVGEETVEQFVRRNLGAEVFERLIEPFCSGVYAGDPSKLSMKAAFGKVYDLEQKGGSIFGGVWQMLQERRKNPPPARDPRLPPKPKGQTVGSFRKGLQSLPQAMAQNMKDIIRTKWELLEIEPSGEGYRLTYKTPDGTRDVNARSVALTIPAYIAADLVRRDCPDASLALKSIDYPPVAAVSIAYPMSAIQQDRLDQAGSLPGFGQLHPRSQGITTLGTIYSSSLFPDRAPPGWQQLLCYIGGATNRGIVDQGEEAIIAQVDKDLRAMLLKEDAPKPKKIGLRIWPKAIPQFNLAHLEAVKGAQEDLDLEGYSGVLLGGNYVSGVALGKCVEYAYEYATKIAQYLKSKVPAATVPVQQDQDEAFFV